MAFSGAVKGSSSEINVTPLIDVLLVLLIIFMVTVPQGPRGLGSSIPQKSANEAAPLPPVVVRVLQSKTNGPVGYSVGERQLSFAELRPVLRSLLEVRQDRTLFIQADRALSYQRVAEVVGEAHAAGALQVALQGNE